MKLAILGYGKMGKVIESIALERGHTVHLKVNSKNADFSIEELKECDVAIEFSSPDFVITNIYKCFEASVPVVIGTTGWYDSFEQIQNDCINQNQSLLHATNFSVGVNIFYEINKKLATLMNSNKQYNVAVEEIHHTEKLDAPSGTAITIAEGIISSIDDKNNWKNDLNVSNDEVGIESKRIANVPGTHIVKYESEIDIIEIKHEAKNRKGFGFGAVVAAEFIQNKKGIYTMKDVLSF